jgi:hypothetical protein
MPNYLQQRAQLLTGGQHAAVEQGTKLLSEYSIICNDL